MLQTPAEKRGRLMVLLLTHLTRNDECCSLFGINLPYHTMCFGIKKTKTCSACHTQLEFKWQPIWLGLTDGWGVTRFANKQKNKKTTLKQNAPISLRAASTTKNLSRANEKNNPSLVWTPFAGLWETPGRCAADNASRCVVRDEMKNSKLKHSSKHQPLSFNRPSYLNASNTKKAMFIIWRRMSARPLKEHHYPPNVGADWTHKVKKRKRKRTKTDKQQNKVLRRKTKTDKKQTTTRHSDRNIKH